MSNRINLESLKNPVFILEQLLLCQSVTPEDDGAQLFIAQCLEMLGFKVQHLPFHDVVNLYASRPGGKGRNLLFAGHSDVVPAEPTADWEYRPFAGHIGEDRIYGRGAQDMKGAIACFIAALARAGSIEGNISLAITGDEEGDAVNGSAKLLPHVVKQGEKWDFALVGEPSCKKQFGDTIKIGRRGSLTGRLDISGVAGHVAYPHLADNAAHKVVEYANRLLGLQLGEATEHFEASNFEITQLAAPGLATNMVPGCALLVFNIRFNDLWTVETLKKLVSDLFAEDEKLKLEWADGASESFVLSKPELANILQDIIKDVTGVSPQLDTNGGTSDARFIKNYCPVAEFGLCGDLMHKVNESVPLADLEALTNIYTKLLQIV